MRRLLLGGTGPALVVPDPPEGGDPPVDPPVDPTPSTHTGWPATTDPTLAAIRPAGRVIAARTVGGSAPTDPNLGAALTAAKQASEVEGQTGSLYWDGTGPDYRTDVILATGNHPGPHGGHAWVNIVGATGDPADTTIAATGSGSGVLHLWGSSHIEGVTLKAIFDPASGAPKYAVHLTSGPYAVNTFANVTFDTAAAAGTPPPGGQETGGSVGSDGGFGQYTLFYKCRFPTGGMNLHGGPVGDQPMTMIFIDCYAPHDIGFAGLGTTTGGKDKLYVIGGTVGSITSDTTTDVYTDRDCPVTGAASVTRGHTDWPKPTRGLPPLQTTLYTPSAVATGPSTTSVTVTDLAPMAPVPGRIYVQRVPARPGLRVTHAGYTATTAAGEHLIRHDPADTPYVRNGAANPSLASGTPADPVTVGTNAWRHYYAYTRYPGDNGIWVGIQWDSAAVRVQGSASLPGLTDCYWSDDGNTLTKATPGTPFPRAHISAER